MFTRTALMIALGFGGALASQPNCLAQGPGSLPFANTYRRPSTSRYQNLGNFANNPLAASNVYQTLVQPAQELDNSRIEQITQARRIGDLQNSVRQLERQPTGLTDQTIRPTGHSATFLNYSHFFPGAR